MRHTELGTFRCTCSHAKRNAAHTELGTSAVTAGLEAGTAIRGAFGKALSLPEQTKQVLQYTFFSLGRQRHGHSTHRLGGGWPRQRHMQPAEAAGRR